MEKIGLSGSTLVVSVCISQIVFYAQSLYLHRCLAHRSVDLHPTVRLLFRLVIWLFFGSDPREWVATHRLHHRFADTDRDPHSPLIAGFWTVALRGSRLVKEACRDRAEVHRLTKDMPPDPLERMPFGRRYGGILLTFVVIVVAMGPLPALWVYVLAVSQILAGTAVVNGLGHLPGPEVSGHVGRNLPVFAPFTAGEALHANHHAKPGGSKLGRNWREVDPGWWAIQVLAFLRLAKKKTATKATEVAAGQTA
jgi:stearoyl-CoA desaturase (Delta-9 desaturase)